MDTDTAVAVPETNQEPMLTRRFMLWCAILLVIVAGGVVVTINHFSGNDTAAPPAVAAEKCDLPASDQTDITGVPDTGWVLIGEGEVAIGVPQSDDSGPALNENGVRSCWAQSPLGAVSAATTFAAMGSAGEEYALARDLTAPGPDRDRLLAETPQETVPVGTGIEVAGFRLVDYTKDDAKVAVVMTDGTALAAATIDVVYVDGDWRYDPPSSLEPEFSFPTSLDGYTEFKKVE